MHGHINIAIAVDLFLATALTMIMLDAQRIQVLRGFAFFAQTVVYTHQDNLEQLQLLSDTQHLGQHFLLPLLAHAHFVPRPFAEKVCPSLRVGMTRLLPIHIAERFAALAYQQLIQHLQQVPPLWRAHYDAERAAKADKLQGMLYYWAEHCLSPG